MKRTMKWMLAPLVVLAALAVTSPSQAKAQWGVTFGSGGVSGYTGFNNYGGGYGNYGVGYGGYGGYTQQQYGAPIGYYSRSYVPPNFGYGYQSFYGGGGYGSHHHHHRCW